jgi:hypothetical protein
MCGMAEAYAKALEHQLLLSMLVSARAASRLSNAEDEGEGEAGGLGFDAEEPRGPFAGGKSFRFHDTPGYEVLPVARVKTGRERGCHSACGV